MVQKAFQVGNSVVVTVPKKVGLKPGTKLSFKKQGNALLYEPLESSATSKIKQTSGAVKVPIHKKNLDKLIKNLRATPYEADIRFS